MMWAAARDSSSLAAMSDAPPHEWDGPGVELSGIAHRFGARWVLRGCTLRVPAGHAIALVGANGVGKTTLLKIMATLLRPKRGSGTVFGKDLLSDANGVRQQVGVLGHSPAVYDDLTAAENVHFACRMRGLLVGPGRIESILTEVGLGSHIHSRARGFSSGMRRRVGLARMLVNPPRLLLMDEPYANLDQEGIELTHELVRRTVGYGGSVVVATHDLPRSLEVATCAVRLSEGLLHPVEVAGRGNLIPDSILSTAGPARAGGSA